MGFPAQEGANGALSPVTGETEWVSGPVSAHARWAFRRPGSRTRLWGSRCKPGTRRRLWPLRRAEQVPSPWARISGPEMDKNHGRPGALKGNTHGVSRPVPGKVHAIIALWRAAHDAKLWDFGFRATNSLCALQAPNEKLPYFRVILQLLFRFLNF